MSFFGILVALALAAIAARVVLRVWPRPDSPICNLYGHDWVIVRADHRECKQCGKASFLMERRAQIVGGTQYTWSRD
jgi:ribosomal protein S27AE